MKFCLNLHCGWFHTILMIPLSSFQLNCAVTMTPKGFIEMYRDGFRQMTVGRTLWVVVILKLTVLFFVVKLFFFPNILERDYSSDRERAAAVRENLTKPNLTLFIYG